MDSGILEDLGEFIFQRRAHRKHGKRHFLRGDHPFELLHFIQTVNVLGMELIEASFIVDKYQDHQASRHTNGQAKNVNG
jgi:hypothetical protein